GRFMCEAHGMAAQPVQHGGEKAAKDASAAIDEIIARNERRADIAARRVYLENLLPERDCRGRFPVRVHRRSGIVRSTHLVILSGRVSPPCPAQANGGTNVFLKRSLQAACASLMSA